MHQYETKNISIQPEYLLKIASHVQILQLFYEQEGLQPLNSPFKNLLQKVFYSLGENLRQWEVDKSLCQCAILKTKVQIEKFCWEKLIKIIQRQSQQQGNIMKHLLSLFLEHFQDYDQIILADRKDRLFLTNKKKDEQIFYLKQQLEVKNQHIEDLDATVRQLTEQNARLFTKIISGVKKKVQFMYSSPLKLKSTSLFQTKSKDSNSFQKNWSAKQVQQTIIDIMQNKSKQENIKNKQKRFSINEYLEKYFRHKFGVKQFAEEMQITFCESLDQLAKRHEKNIFVLFSKILNQQCDEQYYYQTKALYEKITKCLKRHLNTKYGVSFDELEKMYELKQGMIEGKNDISLNQKDIHICLGNLYQEQEIETLKEIFIQLLANSNSDRSNLQIFSKQLINQILNYQLEVHAVSVADIFECIHEQDNLQQNSYYSYEFLETIAVKIGIQKQKVSQFQQQSGKIFTASQIVQIITGMRKQNRQKKRN